MNSSILDKNAEKNMKSQLGVEGNVTIYELPPDFTFQKFKELENKEDYVKFRGYNIATNLGMQQILNLMIAANTTSFTLCGVGSGTTTALVTDSALETSIGTNTINDRYRVSNTAYFETFFGKNDEAGTWGETCILTSDSVMLCRKTISPTFAKSTSNAAVISWQITLTATAD